jgi:hypothetical protein
LTGQLNNYKAGRMSSLCGGNNTYKILIEKPQGTKSFRKHRCRWEDNIKRDLTEANVN